MTQTEIEQAAIEYEQLQRRLNVIRGTTYTFREGAEFVNSRQPYTAEDIAMFIIWANRRWEYNQILDKWLWCMTKEATPKRVTTEELLKLWEEQHNG